MVVLDLFYAADRDAAAKHLSAHQSGYPVYYDALIRLSPVPPKGSLAASLAKEARRERYSIAVPTPTRNVLVYLDENGAPMRWSGSRPLPALNSRVVVTKRDIGDSFVVGYWRTGAELGLMVRPIEPHEWLAKQTAELRAQIPPAPQYLQDGIQCVVGNEIA